LDGKDLIENFDSYEWDWIFNTSDLKEMTQNDVGIGQKHATGGTGTRNLLARDREAK
jgi:hypothetical protein